MFPWIYFNGSDYIILYNLGVSLFIIVLILMPNVQDFLMVPYSVVINILIFLRYMDKFVGVVIDTTKLNSTLSLNWLISYFQEILD